MDTYVYYADQGSLFAVEAFANGTFSEPRFFTIDKVSQVTQMVTFEMLAVYSLTVNTALLLFSVNLI